MACLARSLGMRSIQLKRIGMHEARNRGERMLLTMTRSTVGSVAALMQISMAVRAALLNTDKPHLTSRQNAEFGVGVTLHTACRGMGSLQMKLEAPMFKALRIGNARQGKAAVVGDNEILSMMLGMASRTVGSHATRKFAMQATTQPKLRFNRLMAIQACRSHRLARPSVTDIAVLWPNKPRMLKVCGRQPAR